MTWRNVTKCNKKPSQKPGTAAFETENSLKMKRKRLEEDSDPIEAPQMKKIKLYEQSFVSSDLDLPDGESSTVVLRTTSDCAGWYMSASNPYFSFILFDFYDADIELEDKKICFEVLKNFLSGDEESRLKGIGFFYAKMGKDGSFDNMCNKPTDPMFIFVFELKVEIDGNVHEKIIPLTPRRIRETEQYFKRQIKNLEEKVESLEDQLDDKELEKQE